MSNNKMKQAETLRQMLKHFEEAHNHLNQALYETGEGKRCRKFNTLDVEKVKLYIESILLDEGVI